MFKHYIKIAFRNILKYKTQNLISVCAIAVSLTLLVLVTSLMMSIRQLPFYDLPHMHRIVYASCSRNPLDAAQLNLLKGHTFKSAESVLADPYTRDWGMATAINDDGDERTLLAEVLAGGCRHLHLLGYTSALSGEVLPQLYGDSIIVSKKFADKVFGDSKSAIGRKISVRNKIETEYYIKDVKSSPIVNDILMEDVDIYTTNVRIEDNSRCYNVYALLRDGYDIDDLKDEINELVPGNDLHYAYIKDSFFNDQDHIIFQLRDGVVVFLFLFLLVSVISFLRQQIQLFRIRQREVALRTVLGGKERQMVWQFFIEVCVVITVSVILSLLLSYLVKGVLLTDYALIMSEIKWTISGIFPTTMAVYAVLIAIVAISVALCVRSIKSDQTGLALQMKPKQKHKLRNVGITVQLVLSILFMWAAILAYNSSFFMNRSLGIPDNDDYYRNGISLTLNAVNQPEGDEVYSLLKKSKYIDNVYSQQMTVRQITMNDSASYPQTVFVYIQTANEMTDFYNIDVDVINPDANPSCNVVVSEKLKQTLEKNGMWNSNSLTLEDETYEILGTFKGIPYDTHNRIYMILNDVSYTPRNDRFYIIPKPDKRKEAWKDVEDAVRQVLPSRIDIAPQKLSVQLSPISPMRDILAFVLMVLTIVSVVTTMASIYSCVTLDTRRRRKEMALRKVNGAKAKDICRIFAGTYVWIMIFAVLISFSLCVFVTDSLLTTQEIFPHPYLDFGLSLVAVIVITVFTVAWKIRDVMRVTPMEYLKD